MDSTLKEHITYLFDAQEEQIQRAVASLKVLAHPARLKILCILKNGEQTVQKLETYTELPQATLSQHLTLLKDRGVLASRREGNYSYYRLANDRMRELFDLIQSIYCH